MTFAFNIMENAAAATEKKTILQAAYDLSRTVESAPGRQMMRDILHRLTYQVPNDDVGMHEVGYYGRRQHAQLYGYLVVDQERERYLNSPMPTLVPPLPNDVRQKLRANHEQICSLNHACVQHALSLLPNGAALLNPYGLDIPLVPPSDSVAEEIAANVILPDVAVATMAATFRGHPAFAMLREVPTALGHNWLMNEVRRLEAGIEHYGALQSPPYVRMLKERSSPHSPARQAFHVVGALVCLRASLRTLNQLIFQKLKGDKLPFLGEEHLFAVPLFSAHDTGRGMDVMFQMDEQVFLLEQGDLLLLDAIENHTFPERQLCEVAFTGMGFGGEDGNVNRAHLRPVDENLCPYKAMWDDPWSEPSAW